MKDMKEITTNGITILLVEVPEDVIDYRFKTMPDESKQLVGTVYDDSGHKGTCYITEPIPQGNYQILGKSTELSEEQMKEICPYIERVYGGSYYDYRKPILNRFYYVGTVQQSYLSLLEANGIVDRNLIDEPPKLCIDSLMCDQYQEAQSKVKTYLVLKRI